MENKDEFMQGVIWACARINELHDQPTIAQDVLNETCVTDKDYRQACEYDLEFLRSGNKHIPKGQE